MRGQRRSDLAMENGGVCREECETAAGLLRRFTEKRKTGREGKEEAIKAGESVILLTHDIASMSRADCTRAAEVLASEAGRMLAKQTGAPRNRPLRVLVAGLGNRRMTPDALGPAVVDRLIATHRLLPKFADILPAGCCDTLLFSPGVSGDTGLESTEVVRALSTLAGVDVVIAVDALAAGARGRLGCTIQIADRGVTPGSGVGNHRPGLTAKTVGCPVLSFGIPTVIASGGEKNPDWVCPRFCDRLTERGSFLLAASLRQLLHLPDEDF